MVADQARPDVVEVIIADAIEPAMSAVTAELGELEGQLAALCARAEALEREVAHGGRSAAVSGTDPMLERVFAVEAASTRKRLAESLERARDSALRCISESRRKADDLVAGEAAQVVNYCTRASARSTLYESPSAITHPTAVVRHGMYGNSATQEQIPSVPGSVRCRAEPAQAQALDADVDRAGRDWDGDWVGDHADLLDFHVDINWTGRGTPDEDVTSESRADHGNEVPGAESGRSPEGRGTTTTEPRQSDLQIRSSLTSASGVRSSSGGEPPTATRLPALEVPEMNAPAPLETPTRPAMLDIVLPVIAAAIVLMVVLSWLG